MARLPIVARTLVVLSSVACLACLPTWAQAPSFPDPMQAARAGLPVVPDPLAGELLPTPGGTYPLKPLDRDPTEGLRHGLVQTSSGRFGFAVTDLTLPSRVPLTVGRLYDAGIYDSMPGVPVGLEPRFSNDLGVNWLLSPTSVLTPNGPGMLILLTDEAGVVQYVADGTGKYVPSPDRPGKFGIAQPTGSGGFWIYLSNGLTRTYSLVPSESSYWLVKEEDQSGNALNFTYQGRLLKRIDATDGAWVEFHRPMWGESAPSGTPSKRVRRISAAASGTTAMWQMTFSYDSLWIREHAW